MYDEYAPGGSQVSSLFHNNNQHHRQIKTFSDYIQIQILQDDSFLWVTNYLWKILITILLSSFYEILIFVMSHENEKK